MRNRYPDVDIDCSPTQDERNYCSVIAWVVSWFEDDEGRKVFTFSKDTPEEALNKYLSFSDEFKEECRISDTYYIEK